jgi:microcystin-dependent protein
MSFWKWSRTAANNATADGSINWAEGQAPSTVNDSARAMMAAASKYRDDVAGAIATAGTSSAYTLASFQVFDTLAHMDGAMIAFTAHAGNAGACTLNVDGLGAKPLRSAPSTELLAGMLVAGTPYAATYYNVSGEWILRGLTGAPGIPLGVALPYFGVTAPGSAFALPFGQAISRTTYVNLFNLIATTYGAGDGGTTFNLPDLRGYLLAGKDDMGGAAASRITAGASGIDGTVLGAAGGAQTVTLITAQMPAHGHGVSDPAHAHGVSDPSHSHGVNDPTHAHAMNFSTGATTNGGVSLFGFVDNVGAGANVATSQASATGVSLNANTTGVSVNAAATGIAIQAAGGGAPHQNMPPTRICNFIMRIL